MLYWTLGLFLFSAVFGLLIVRQWLAHREASRAIVYTHGGVAALALVLLLIHALRQPDRLPQIAAGLFTVAALFGFYMFFNDLKNRFSPWGVAIAHALLAVGGVLVLLVFLFT
jgi:hypothetical protein